MFKYYQIHIIIIIQVLFSCSHNTITQEDINDTKYISDLLVIDKNTYIAAKWYGQIIKSTDAGKTWQTINTPLFNQLAIDSNKRIWAIHSWQGIHEESKCTIYISDDLGINWSSYKFDPFVFFPVYFTKQLINELEIIDVNDSIYQFVGKMQSIHHKDSWKFIRNLTNDEIESLTAVLYFNENYKIYRGGIIERKDQKTKKWIKILDDESINYPTNFIETKDKLLITEGAGTATFFVIDKKTLKVQSYKLDGNGVSGIRIDFHDRIWIYGEGLYIYDNESVNRIW